MNDETPELTTIVKFDEIDFDGSPKVRDHLNEDVVESYSDIYRAVKDMPPVILFRSGEGMKYLLADGAHRCAAVSLLGADVALAYVKKGTFVDALKYALKANSAHGLPRTNADKRLCISTALKQWPEKSNLSISEMCDVDDKTVASVREEMEAATVIAPSPVRTSSSGRSVPSSRAARVSEIMTTAPSPEPPKAPTDFSGTEIPRAIIKYWNRAQEVKDILSNLSAIMGALKKAQHDEDLMFSEINISATLGDMEKSWTAIQCAIPYSVCTQCQGHPELHKGGCRLCLGRGLISKFRYERLVPEELKKMKEKK